MATEFRKSGISVVGDVPWGTHFCHFYETKQDLLDTLIPYFKAGLESKEFCLWVISDAQLITVEEAKGALAQAVPDLERHISDESIEILNAPDWYLQGNVFNLERVTRAWDAKLKRALARGYEGMRVSGDTFWLAEKDWKDFFAYEKQLNASITDQPMTVLCTYPLAKSGAGEVLDVVQSHQFAIARRQGKWEVIETPELIQAKAKIKRLNEELEQRVIDRTSELRVANEELRKEKEILEKIFDNIPVLIGFVGEDGRVKLVNPEWERTMGWTLKELQEQGVDIFAEAYPDLPYRQEVLDFVAAATGQWVDLKIRVRDGRVIDAACAVVHLSDGTKIAIAQDITVRKRSEDALRRSEDRNRLIIDTIPTMAWSIRPDGAIDFVNQRWMDYTGLSMEEESEEPTRPIHPEDAPRVMERWLVEMEVGEAYEEEMRIRRVDGEYRWFLVRTAPLRDEQGNLVKWYGVSTDIEDLKRAEEALKESQRRLEEAQRVAHVGHWDRDLETRRITWSDEVYRILGLPLEEHDSPRTEWLEVVHPEDRPRLSLLIQEAERGIRRLDTEFRIVRPNGEVRFLHSQGDVIRDERDRPVHMFGTAQDITEHKRAEEQLKATTEQLRSLSARLQSAREQEGIRIARELHDELGATMSSLRWNLEEVVEVISDSTDLSHIVDLTKRIEAMIELTDTTLNVVRRIASELRPIALDELGLSEAIEWQAQQFQKRTGIFVQCDCDQESGKLSEEQSTAVFRIFQEALTNILRHAEATGVNIQMKESDSELILTVSDNGRGITDEEKSGRRTLGLLGMRERAHLIGGEVSISRAEGGGTVVTVRAPIADREIVRRMSR